MKTVFSVSLVALILWGAWWLWSPEPTRLATPKDSHPVVPASVFDAAPVSTPASVVPARRSAQVVETPISIPAMVAGSHPNAKQKVDADGVVLEETVASPDGEILKRYVYGEDGRLMKAVYINKDNKMEEWIYSYDAAGKVSIRVTDSQGNVTIQ